MGSTFATEIPKISSGNRCWYAEKLKEGKVASIYNNCIHFLTHESLCWLTGTALSATAW
jgi:hypothetical protein